MLVYRLAHTNPDPSLLGLTETFAVRENGKARFILKCSVSQVTAKPWRFLDMQLARIAPLGSATSLRALLLALQRQSNGQRAIS